MPHDVQVRTPDRTNSLERGVCSTGSSGVLDSRVENYYIYRNICILYILRYTGRRYTERAAAVCFPGQQQKPTYILQAEYI